MSCPGCKRDSLPHRYGCTTPGWREDELTQATRIIEEIRRNLSDAGVEGSPPPWETTIGALTRRAYEAESEVKRLEMDLSEAYDVIGRLKGDL